MDQTWLAGRIPGTLGLVREEPGKKRKSGARLNDDGYTICAFYAKKQRVDGGCSDMNKFVSTPTWISSEGLSRKGRRRRKEQKQRWQESSQVTKVARAREERDCGKDEGTGLASGRGQTGKERGDRDGCERGGGRGMFPAERRRLGDGSGAVVARCRSMCVGEEYL